MALARKWAATRREREANKYDDVLEAIDEGRVTIRNADAAKVRSRLRNKAERVRAGENVRRRISKSRMIELFDE